MTLLKKGNYINQSDVLFMNDVIIKVNVEKSIKNVLKELIKFNFIKSKSKNTTNHCIRVSKLSYIIGKEFNLSIEDMDNLLVSSDLHDIGKLFITDEILNKPYSLTQDEYEIMKMHSAKGFEYINKF